jgi:hypothetical protein
VGPATAQLQVTDTDGGHIRPQDILVSTNNAGSTLTLIDEYTTSGLLVQQFAAPATEEARDLIVDENGQIQLYNGTFSPTLTTVDPATGNNSEQTIAGLSTVNNVSFGGIATFHQFVYLTDMATAGAGAPQGVVRVDLTDRSWQRFAGDKQFQDLTIGGDGLLYGLDGSGLPGNQITVYNPVTMAQVRSFSLPFNDYRGIAVSATGDVFASGWDGTISHFDGTGKLLASVATGVNNLSSIDLRSDGTLVAGSRFSQIVLTDTSLNPATVAHFTVGIQPVFAAFAASTILPSPTLDTTPGALTVNENDPPAAIDPGLLVTTDGEQLTGATVQIGTGFQSNQDVLGFVNQNGVTSVYNQSTGLLTLSGSATTNQYQAALRSVTYSNTSDNPDATPRTITFSVTDGTYSVSAAKTIDPMPDGGPPVIGNQTFSLLEKSPNGTAVGVVSASNPDADDALTFAIVSGNTNNAFAISATTGQITVADSSKLNFLVQSTYSLTVRATDSGSPSQAATATVTIQLIFQPTIDIKPGDATNTITLGSGSTIPVAILSTASFNAATKVNASSLRFGRTGSEASPMLNSNGQPNVKYWDLNGDGRSDLLVMFVTSQTGLQTTDTQAVLTGQLVSGANLESFGMVHIVNPKTASTLASNSAIQPTGAAAALSSLNPMVFVDPASIEGITAPLFIDDQQSKRR